MLKVSVPATSANLGPGFDLIGLALELYNEFYVLNRNEQKPYGSVMLSSRSLFHRAFTLLAKTVNKETADINVAMRQKVPRSRGLGSSATLTVGGLVAANVLLGAGFSDEQLIGLAASIEGHPDNAAPALVGGLAVCMKTMSGIKYIKIMANRPLQAVIAVPEFELSTSIARKVLPHDVPHKDAVQNTGRFGFFITSMLTGDYSLLAMAMEDLLHQPYRLHLVPGLKEVMDAAVDAGALGSCLSGAGPSVLAFADKNILEISESMKNAWKMLSIKADIYVLNIAAGGASYQFSS